MRVQLLHLSGPQRGQTITYKANPLLFGTVYGADIRYPTGGSIQPRHAELTFVEEECAFHLKALDGEVFVNCQQVNEVILEAGDLIEVGPDGPRMRFRVHYEEGAVCKPVRLMLSDAKEVRGASGFFASTRALQHDLISHSSWQLKTLLLSVVPVMVFFAAYLGGTVTGRRVTEVQEVLSEGLLQKYSVEIAKLREQWAVLQRTQSAAVSREEVEQFRQELDQSRLLQEEYAERSAAMKQVFEVYSRGVCLVHGMYTLMIREGEELIPVPGPDGEPLVAEYFGSGFLAAKGFVVTNRHVVEPWWRNDEIESLIERGLIPSFVYLSVTFPGHEPMPVDPETIRISTDEVDIAVMQVDVSDVPVLPLFEGDLRAARGDRVMLLGYPTGTLALLARAESNVANEIFSAAHGDNKLLIMELARRGAISPIITQGALNEVLERRLVYDAGTTGGGSGGPVFGPDGTVVGVNFAMTRDFHASNFGVPIQFARALLNPGPIAHSEP